MLVFVIFSLGLCFIQEFASSLQIILVSPYFFYAGLIAAIVGIVSAFLGKWAEIISYEIFSSGTLMLWFAYWKPLFKPDTPIFFFYPLYFALMSAFITLFLTDQARKIDKDTLHYMQNYDKERVMPAWAIMLCVLGSLEVREHYQLYPILMTLLMLRYAFSCCIQQSR